MTIFAENKLSVIMNDAYQMIPVNKLEPNNGQLEGLPKNPRYIREDEYEKLKRSIQSSPEFLEARMLLVYPLANGNYIVIAGNMRLRACSELGFNKLPCYVFKAETSIEKLREYAIKDNANFGNWDYDILANESWSDDIDLLAEWGAPVEFLRQDEWEDLPLIEDEQPDPVLDKPVKIVVTIANEQKEMEKEIRDLLTETLKEFEGVKVE